VKGRRTSGVGQCLAAADLVLAVRTE